jgi:hypothetical protein
MNRGRALKVVLGLVGVIFLATVYPLVTFMREDPALSMMFSLYVTLGDIGSRNPDRLQETANPSIANSAHGTHRFSSRPKRSFLLKRRGRLAGISSFWETPT